MSKYGENIKKIRSVRGLTQSQLADIIDVSRAVISSYEEGRAEPKIETIIKTAEVFQVTVDALLKKNITVNQLSGFTLPEILSDKKQQDISPASKELSELFPKSVIIIPAKKLNDTIYCKDDEIVFGIKEAPVKNKLCVIELNSEFIIGKITEITEKSIVLDGAGFVIANVKSIIKVIGIYHPVHTTTPLDERLLQMEKRLKQLEDNVKKK